MAALCMVTRRLSAYQLLFWQPPPSDPVLPAGVHSRLVLPLASRLIENVCPSVASAVTVYSSLLRIGDRDGLQACVARVRAGDDRLLIGLQFAIVIPV